MSVVSVFLSFCLVAAYLREAAKLVGVLNHFIQFKIRHSVRYESQTVVGQKPAAGKSNRNFVRVWKCCVPLDSPNSKRKTMINHDKPVTVGSLSSIFLDRPVHISPTVGGDWNMTFIFPD